MGKKIAIVNASTVMSDTDASKITDALQIQSRRDFAPYWGVGADLLFVPTGKVAPAGYWQLILLDNSDVGGALGYHDVTAEGLPQGKAFVGTDLKYGYTPSVTISHELLEMLADPDINQTIFMQSTNTKGRLYAKEVCDAVEADNLGYEIDGILVSDFVTQQWFESFNHSPGTHYSFMKRVTQPFQLAPGGYIGVFDVTRGSGWQQITAEAVIPMAQAYQTLPPVGSRRERRARFWRGESPVVSSPTLVA